MAAPLWTRISARWPTLRRAASYQRRGESERARHALAEQLAKAYVPNPRLLELIEAVLYRADCNAHAFQAGQLGMFPLAALANHSCDPSCSTRRGSATRCASTRRAPSPRVRRSRSRT